jgi:hypothetical protein
MKGRISMDHAYVEHANVTVCDLDEVKDMLLCALPGWRVRGEGTMDWFGQRKIRWLHVGTEHSYIALQSGGEGVADHLSPTAVMEPPMFGVMEPATGG